MTMTTHTDELIPPKVEAVLNRQFQLLVGGRLVPALSGASYEVLSPVTETVIAQVPDAGTDDVEAAVTAAEAARKAWRRTIPADRAAMVQRLADAIEAHAEELALLDAIDAGSPINNARNDVAMAVAHLRMFASFALEMKGTTIPASSNIHMTLREPIGIVARIVPFNHPLMFACKIAAPLVAGNCVILKAPDVAPLSSLRLGELAADVFPEGVLSILVGNGSEVPRAIVRHPKVRRIGFIGSESTGRSIQREAAEAGVKEVTLELGGKNAMLVFPDADLDKAAAGAVAGMNFTWSGQSCGSNSRLLVHESIADEVTAKVVKIVNALTIGNPLDETCDQGTMISRAQYQKALDYIDIAKSEGATVLTGGGRPDGFERGFYVSPTVLTDVGPETRIAREEVFGPVLSILTFSTEDEAITIANSVDYGLTASVWTENITRAHRVIGELEAGFTWINGSSRHFPNVPYGGYKASGIGREESIEELLSYTELKTVNIML
ncbi:aldehyde dehydrogenase family protein [Pseudarthrobacter sp. WHRI 8279]|uniref:aldehyde dehydrogenase family protein n=1 Tax=Pseudarthrobacter sp. WHRI 8279 TaxID=3162566 RepID=UPI0032EF9A25